MISENENRHQVMGEMTVRAIQDYFRSFRFDNIVTGDNFYIAFYFSFLPMFYAIVFIEKENMADWRNMWVVLWGMISMLIALMGTRINSLPFSKIVYLCPMSIEKRHEYTVAMFWVRIVFPVLLFIAGRLILWIVMPVGIFYLLIDIMLILAISGVGMTGSSTNFYGFNTQSTNLAYGESSPLVVEVMFEQRFAKKTPINEAANKGVFSMLIGYFTYFFVTGFGLNKLPYGLWIGIVLLFLYQLYLTYKMYSKLGEYIQYASSYEGV